MSLKPTILNWASVETAATWPEGITVARVQMRNGVPDWRTFEFSRFHRPDFCGKDGMMAHFSNTHFARVRDSSP